jgi:hypothetical protein
MSQSIQSFLESLEDDSEPQAEYLIRSSIAGFLEATPSYQQTIEAKAEEIAFSLMYAPEGSSWGVSYGPMAVFKGEHGEDIEAPPLDIIDSDVIAYWRKRSSDARNPIFVLRYSDLVWEFSPLILSQRPGVEYAQRAIDASIAIAAGRMYKHETEVFRVLERALELSLSISDGARLTQVKSALIAYQYGIAQDKLPGTWTSAFEALVLNKKINLQAEEEAEPVGELEGRLSTFLDESINDESWLSPAEIATNLLVEYYGARHDDEKLRSTLRTYTKILLNSCEHMQGISKLFWMKRLYDTLTSYGLKEEAANIAVKLQGAGKEAESELKPISASVELSTEEIEEFFAGFVEGTRDEALVKLAARFVPNRRKIQRQLHDISSEEPLSFLVSRTILERGGRVIAQIPSLQEDPEGQYAVMLNQNLQFDVALLRGAIDRVFNHFDLNATALTEYLEQSPSFPPGKHGQLLKGIDSYLKRDHISAVSILVPVIEASVRELVQLCGRPTYKRGRHGGLDLRALGDCLFDPCIANVFGEDIRDYFAAVLVDPRGWNLRNNVSHGLFDDEYFAATVSDRLIHVLLVLAVVRAAGEGE